jgi:hypothetical protein
VRKLRRHDGRVKKRTIKRRKKTMANDLKKITLDGVEYVRADQAQPAPLPGKRYVLVLDRGWIVAGDVTDVAGDPNHGARIKVTRALHVRSWSSVGFDGMVASPKGGNVVVKPLPNGFDCPADAELFRVPVADDWGM